MRKQSPIVPYGVPIRDVIASGDKELMHAMIMVSDFIAKSTGVDRHDDWAQAHRELQKAVY